MHWSCCADLLPGRHHPRALVLEWRWYDVGQIYSISLHHGPTPSRLSVSKKSVDGIPYTVNTYRDAAFQHLGHRPQTRVFLGPFSFGLIDQAKDSARVLQKEGDIDMICVCRPKSGFCRCNGEI